MTGPSETIDTPATRSYDFADSLLTAVNNGALSLLVDLPAHQYITTGQPAFDCPQVAITLVSLQTGIPGDDTGASGAPTAFDCQGGWSVIAEISIVREGYAVASNGSANLEDIKTSAKASSADCAVLDEALREITSNSFSITRAAITYGAYEGGLIATAMRLTAALP